MNLGWISFTLSRVLVRFILWDTTTSGRGGCWVHCNTVSITPYSSTNAWNSEELLGTWTISPLKPSRPQQYGEREDWRSDLLQYFIIIYRDEVFISKSFLRMFILNLLSLFALFEESVLWEFTIKTRLPQRSQNLNFEVSQTSSFFCVPSFPEIIRASKSLSGNPIALLVK